MSLRARRFYGADGLVDRVELRDSSGATYVIDLTGESEDGLRQPNDGREHDRLGRLVIRDPFARFASGRVGAVLVGRFRSGIVLLIVGAEAEGGGLEPQPTFRSAPSVLRAGRLLDVSPSVSALGRTPGGGMAGLSPATGGIPSCRASVRVQASKLSRLAIDASTVSAVASALIARVPQCYPIRWTHEWPRREAGSGHHAALRGEARQGAAPRGITEPFPESRKLARSRPTCSDYTLAIPLYNAATFARVDEDVMETLSAWRWHLDPKGYAIRQSPRGDGPPRKILMHRAALGLTAGDERHLDHINGNRLDNRRTNLRFATVAENAQNLRSLAGSASRYRGVTWHAKRGCWQAAVKLNGKTHYLGLFAYEEAAAQVAAVFRAKHMPFSAEAAA